MARFTVAEAQEILKSPRNKVKVKRGRRYESFLRLFTEPLFKDELANEEAWEDYLNFLKITLSENKYKRVVEFIQYPLSVNDNTESIMNELYKVFDSKNSFFKNEFKSDTDEKIINEALSKINIRSWIEENGKSVLKNKPNSIVVVDKDSESNPYLILVESNDIIDVELNKRGQCEYIAFIHSVITVGDSKLRLISFYDDEFYRVFLEDEKGEYSLFRETEHPHGIGYCPARSFIDTPLNNQNFFTRKSPLGNSLSKLSEWQIFDTYKFYTDHYAPFPVIETVEEDCSVEKCEGGQIAIEQDYIADNQRKTLITYRECPSCSAKGIIGPGTVLTLPAVAESKEEDGSGKFRMVSPEVKNLEYIADKLVKIENNIELKVVGKNELLSKEAVNKDQVKGSFDTKLNVLLSTKTYLDNIHKWIVKTVAKSVMPTVEFSLMVNYGTEFYILTEEQLQERFNAAKKAGLPPVEIAMIFTQLVETKYKGNPESIMRIDLIKMIDPMPFDNLDDKLKKVQNGIVSKNDLILSENMIRFVDRFERENASLTEFGKELELNERINKIFEILKIYTDEQARNGTVEPVK